MPREPGRSQRAGPPTTLHRVMGSGTSNASPSEEVSPLRRFLGGLLLVLAACLLLASAALIYALTKEYGYSPNDDPIYDLSQAATSSALVALLTAALAAGGLVLATRLRRRARVLSVTGVFVAAFVVLGLSMVVGQQALDARCAGSDRHSTGAC